jgi:hypothetical protein
MKKTNDNIIKELKFNDRKDMYLRTITLRMDELEAALDLALRYGAENERGDVAEWLRNVSKLGYAKENSALIGGMCNHLAAEIVSGRYKK